MFVCVSDWVSVVMYFFLAIDDHHICLFVVLLLIRPLQFPFRANKFYACEKCIVAEVCYRSSSLPLSLSISAAIFLSLCLCCLCCCLPSIYHRLDWMTASAFRQFVPSCPCMLFLSVYVARMHACVCMLVCLHHSTDFCFVNILLVHERKKKWKKISSIETSAKYDHAKSALIFVFAPNIIMVSWFSLVWTCCRIYFCFLPPPPFFTLALSFLLGCIENERVFVHLQSLSLRKSSASMRNKCMLIH